MIINLLKLIILYAHYRYLCRSFKAVNRNSIENYYINNETYNYKDCNHSYEYSKFEKYPSKKENGTKLNICKYCKNRYYENIPILNNEYMANMS